MATKPVAPVKPVTSLVSYVRKKRREGCEVCALPVEVKDQLRTANAKKISVPIRLEWLRDVVKVHITREQFDQHVKGAHDFDEG